MNLTLDDPLSPSAEPAPHPQEHPLAPWRGRGRRTHAADRWGADRSGGLTWVDTVAPDLETAQALAERFGWHPLDVEDIVSKRQRSKVDDYEEERYLFAVLHFPVFDKNVKRLNAEELDMSIGEDYVVTIPNRELLPVTRLFRRCEEDEEYREQVFARGSGRLLYEVLDDLFDYCFPILDKIGRKLDGIEDEMFEGAAEEVVRDISNVKQEIISYRKMIKPERSTLRVLERRVPKFLPGESSSTSTTSSTPSSGSGTGSITTRRSSRRSSRRTSR